MSASFKVGDKVTWTHTIFNGNSIRMRTREGKIVELSETSALCQMRNGRKNRLHLDALAHANQPSGLTKAFLEMGKNLSSQP